MSKTLAKKTSGKWRRSPEALVKRFEEITKNLNNIEPRKMFGYPCAFCNGHLFVGLHQENMVLKLDDDDRDEFFKKYRSRPFEPMAGRIMREYVMLPQEVIASDKPMKEWLQRSLAYVKSLPPKIAKKKSR